MQATYQIKNMHDLELWNLAVQTLVRWKLNPEARGVEIIGDRLLKLFVEIEGVEKKKV